MSQRTVEEHRCRIKEKMRTETIVGIVKYAIAHGIYKLFQADELKIRGVDLFWPIRKAN
jgi:ribosomal protein L14E/L6E/L27E